MSIKNSNNEISLKAELWGTQQFLPGCRNCGERHPLAMKPVPVDPTICTGCGMPAGTPGEVQSDRATSAGFDPVLMLGNVMLAIGRWFARLAKE